MSLISLLFGSASATDALGGWLVIGSFMGGITGLGTGLVAGWAVLATITTDAGERSTDFQGSRHLRRVAAAAAAMTATLILILLIGGFALSSLEGAVIYLAIPVAAAGCCAHLVTPWVLRPPSDIASGRRA